MLIYGKIKSMEKNLFILFTIVFFSSFSCAMASKTHLHPEKDYQKIWCEKNCGKTEVVLPDKTRVDCVTKTHAIEFDFAPKWAESIGQALYYGKILKKTAGIVLIVENENRDKKYIKRLQTVAKNQGITVWLMFPGHSAH